MKLVLTVAVALMLTSTCGSEIVEPTPQPAPASISEASTRWVSAPTGDGRCLIVQTDSDIEVSCYVISRP